MKKFKVLKLFNKLETVAGYCEHCDDDSLLISIVDDFYRCTNCGEDTKQYINGSIRYIKLSGEDQKWLKNQSSE